MGMVANFTPKRFGVTSPHSNAFEVKARILRAELGKPVPIL